MCDCMKNIDYKGHSNLADMISTHIHIYRDLLQKQRDEDFENHEYWEHELKALADIEHAVNQEKQE